MQNGWGNWYIVAGGLSGGTFTNASNDGSTNLIATAVGGTLNNVTLASPIDMSSVDGATLTVTNGLTLANGTTLVVGSGVHHGVLNFFGTQTLSEWHGNRLPRVRFGDAWLECPLEESPPTPPTTVSSPPPRS